MYNHIKTDLYENLDTGYSLILVISIDKIQYEKCLFK